VGIVLTGATLVELEPAAVANETLRIEDNLIVARGKAVQLQPSDELVDLSGKVVMPGLISAHHLLYGTLTRGAKRSAQGFEGELALLHKLEDALTLEDVEAASAAGAIEGLKHGVTCVFDLHASPKAIGGSLQTVARGLGMVGLRAVLAYQVSERHGALGREEGLDECREYAKRARGRFRGAIGAAGLGAMGPDGIEALKLGVEGGLFLHCKLGDDPNEEKLSSEKYGATALGRLMEQQLVNERTLLASGVHLSWPELAQVLTTGAWMAHAPRANMASQTGSAHAGKFGIRACLGTDVMALDLFAEAQAAWLKARDAGQPIDVLRFLANNQRLASAAFGAQIGPLREGAIADLVVLDYQPFTPLTADTLSAHLNAGLSASQVESVMVDGVWRLLERKVLGVDAKEVSAAALESAKAVWGRMEK
jgi:cytosine/adenosine deaminase-related metal-dependent hydrolase